MNDNDDLKQKHAAVVEAAKDLAPIRDALRRARLHGLANTIDDAIDTAKGIAADIKEDMA